MLYLISVFFSFIAVVFATPLLANLLSSLEIVDHPDNDRKIHTTPIPRMGGIIIYSVIVLFLIFLFPLVYEFKNFLIGSLIIFLLGIADDIWGIKWDIKFIFQSIVTVLLISYLNNHNYFQFNIFGFNIPDSLSVPIMFFFILGSMNAFNLLDGLDGLVSGFSLLIGSLSFILSFNSDSTFVPLLSILIIGTTLGFLKFNSNPASIFLGDSGSLILAYFSLTILLSSAGEISNHNIDLAFIGMVLAVPLIDTLRVMLVRILNKRNPFLPDKNHIHHIIYSKKIRHKTTVFIILSLTLVSIIIGLYYFYSSKTLGLILFFIFTTILLFIDSILNFLINKNNLLFYGRMIKLLPVKFASFYRFYILPFITFLVFSFLIFLLISKGTFHDTTFVYLLIFNFLSVAYVLINLKNRNYISELFVFTNFVVFFFITSSGNTFYKLYYFPILKFINLNQLFAILIIPILILFFLLRDKIEKGNREGFLSGIDLIISLLIISNYMFVKFSGFAHEYYYFADILVRSFLLYLLYKIIVGCFPNFKIQVYFASYVIVIIALLRILIS